MQFKLSKKFMGPIVIVAIAVVSIVLFGKGKAEDSVLGTTSNHPSASISVKAGYTPNEVTLPANKETVLKFLTNNTYDCSASLSIPKLGIEKFLPPNGETEVTLPPQVAGTEVIAGCASGSYSFKIKFL